VWQKGTAEPTRPGRSDHLPQALSQSLTKFAEAASATELLAARSGFSLDAFDGLSFEGVPLAALAAAYGTPCWVYGAGTLRDRYLRLQKALPCIRIHYAVKANDHVALLALLAGLGAGADVVSGGELRRALHAGVPAADIVFSGVGKTTCELAEAIEAGIGQINVESPEELATLSAIAAARGLTAPIALRVNPDVDAGTHEKISTGRAGDKFGIALGQIPSLYAHAATLPGISPVGLAVHIGSQISGAAPFVAAYARLASLIRNMRDDGLAVHRMDCGGGLGIRYDAEPSPLPETWFSTIARAFTGMDLALSVEPGRWIAAPAGLLLARVVRTRRKGMARPVVILDAAMNDLLRPAMYDAWHAIVPVGPADLVALPESVDIAGPVCESSDFFAHARKLAPLKDGALVAILDAGAYGAVMSSGYNSRPLASQCMVQRGRHALIRARGGAMAPWKDEMQPRFQA
jgi:diaminopimelate decarboxylase